MPHIGFNTYKNNPINFNGCFIFNCIRDKPTTYKHTNLNTTGNIMRIMLDATTMMKIYPILLFFITPDLLYYLL